MAVDDSCRTPGAVPFKWEIQPGVPKVQQQQQKPLPAPPQHCHHNKSSPPQKLKPPPAAASFHFLPTPDARSRTSSFRASPRVRSERWRFHQPALISRPECVTPGCFPSPLLRRKHSKKTVKFDETASEPDYTSSLETLARWSVSRKRSLSPFISSPASSFSSFRSSPRPADDGDAEWAGFGLF